MGRKALEQTLRVTEAIDKGGVDDCEDKDRKEDDDEQEARAATGMEPTEASRLVHRQVDAGLHRKNAFVLGTVILEDTANVTPVTDTPHVADEDGHAYGAGDEVELQRAFGGACLLRRRQDPREALKRRKRILVGVLEF